MTDVRLKKDLSRALRAGHPWVYRDALERIRAKPGDVVTVRDRTGRFLGRGIADGGPIAVRVWTTRDEPINAAFVRRRVRDAVRLRERTMPPHTDAVRLLHGEGDRLGGIVCDRYGAHAVMRIDGTGAERWVDAAAEALVAEARLEGLLVKTGRRGDTQVRTIHGTVPEELEVLEHGMRLLVDPHRGQKTGLFLDHRESRRQARRLAEGMRVLNLYGYTGGFSIAAGLGGARSVETVDVAEGALGFATRGWALNGLGPSLHTSTCEDVPRYLKRAAEEKREWDFIVSDPPSFAPQKDAARGALKAYRALHRSCLKRLTDGGLYLTASCSSHVGRETFERTLSDAAEKAKAVVQILGRWGAAPDHPRLLAFPEGDYLCVVLCRISR